MSAKLITRSYRDRRVERHLNIYKPVGISDVSLTFYIYTRSSIKLMQKKPYNFQWIQNGSYSRCQVVVLSYLFEGSELCDNFSLCIMVLYLQPCSISSLDSGSAPALDGAGTHELEP